jgi:WD40 repeat protein
MALYTRDGVLPITLPGSASLQLSNLSVSESDSVCYVRFSEVVIVDSSGEVVRLPTPRSQIHQACFIKFNGKDHVAILSNTGLQLWSGNGLNMIHFFSISTLDDVDSDQFFRGVAVSGENICVGTSMGRVLVFHTIGIPDISVAHDLGTSKSPISAMVGSDKYVVCGNDDGEVFVFNAKEAYHQTCKFPATGHVCTALLLRDEVVVAAYSSGHIRVFRLDIQEQSLEVTAHIRAISALALNPNQNVFASCAEDQTVQMWSWPEYISTSVSSMDILFSTRIENRMLTGAAFFVDGRLGVTSFDDSELVVFRHT